MQESIVFCSACMMSSLRKFTFAISSPDEFLVCYTLHALDFFLKVITTFVYRGMRVSFTLTCSVTIRNMCFFASVFCAWLFLNLGQ